MIKTKIDLDRIIRSRILAIEKYNNTEMLFEYVLNNEFRLQELKALLLVINSEMPIDTILQTGYCQFR